MKHLKTLLLFLFFVPTLFAQVSSPTQTVRGKILQANTYRPVEAAVINIPSTQQNAISETDGSFRIENVPIGRQQLQVSFLGYKVTTIPVLVESGKEVVLEIPLQTSSTGLDTIVIKAPRLEVTSPLSSHVITIEETLRLPATFYDPARMMTTQAGVVALGDQANHISVRGNSPNHLSWRLEGVEIVNPNHTANGGTVTDLPTLNGGGVNILSAQMLGDSRFYKGNFPTQFSNVIGGLLDMRLRKGNDEKHEFIGQIGLIGIDVAAEGPISKKSKAAYLANYRYSTFGLLSQMGVDLGGEAVGFQDASLNFSFPTKKLGDFTVFGVWGKSTNIFTGADADLPVEERAEQKQAFDIDFDSRSIIVGGTHQLAFGKNMLWKTSLAYSTFESSRIAQLNQADWFSDDKRSVYNRSSYGNAQEKLSIHSRLTIGVNEHLQITSGLIFNKADTDISALNSFRDTLGTDFRTWISEFDTREIYSNAKIDISKKLSANIGLRFGQYQSFTLGDWLPIATDNWKLYERLSLAYQLNPKHALRVAYGNYGQNVFANFVESRQIGLNYRWQINQNTNFQIESYYQVLTPNTSRATYNSQIIHNTFELALNDFTPSVYTIAQQARNYGIEASLQRFITDDYYFIANASLFESQVEIGDKQWQDSRWNNQYALNLTAGKEWTKQKKKARRIFGLNARAAYGGGLRYAAIDTENSDAFVTRYLDPNDFSQQYPDYFQLDLRLYWKRNKAKYNTMLSLDIQNATNQKNIAFAYYDALLEQTVTKKSLGIIPILSWRIEL